MAINLNDWYQTDSYPTFQEKVAIPETDPQDGPQICVKFGEAYLPYIIGALYQLMSPNTWDGATLADVDRAQNQANDLIYLFQSAQPCIDFCPQPTPVGTLEDLPMPIRVDCECRVFVTCCDGTEVQLATVPMLAPANVNQPSQGAPQAPSGGCATYHGQMSAGNQWLLPTLVSTGDTLLLANDAGAGHDPSDGLNWRCPDGEDFVAGACIGLTHFVGTDPLPLTPHMALIWNIGGTFYPAIGTAFTVPGGVSSAQAYLQVNDSAIADDTGTYTFDVTYCNNGAPTQFTHHWDFKTSPGSWNVDSHGGDSNVAWISGTGFQATTTVPLTAGDGAVTIGLNNLTNLAHCTLRIKGFATDGSGSPTALAQQTAPFPPAAAGEEYTSAITGAIDFSHAFAATLTRLVAEVNAGGTLGDVATITDFYVTADGVDPF